MKRTLPFVALLLALGAEPARAQHDHTQHPHGLHSHRGPGPHFIDALWVENAYLERKLRPDLQLAFGDDGDRYTVQLEVEWAVHSRVSLIAHLTAHHAVPVVGDRQTGIGDISLGPKVALVNDRQRLIFALGGDLTLPTGDEERGLGEEHAAVAPFGLVWVPFGPARRLLLQAAGHLDIPLSGDGENHLELGTAVSWTSPAGLTPLVEGLVEIPLAAGEAASWALAPGFRWEFARAWELGASARFPVAGPREHDLRLIAGVIRHFPLP